MKTFLLLLALVPDLASADALYKCMRNGKASYQDAPCDAASRQTRLESGASGSMAGCYVAEFSRMEGGSSPERLEIRAAGAGYEMVSGEGKGRQAVPMKRATADELREVAKGFHLRLSEGISLKWPPGTPNQRPVGIYKGIGEDGKPVLLAYFFIANGLAKKVDCR